jgi:hypothetical protein
MENLKALLLTTTDESCQRRVVSDGGPELSFPTRRRPYTYEPTMISTTQLQRRRLRFMVDMNGRVTIAFSRFTYGYRSRAPAFRMI